MSEISLQKFIRKLEEYDIATVTWTIFYDSDETHFEDDPDVVDINGKHIDVTILKRNSIGAWVGEVHPAFQDYDDSTNYHGNQVEGWKGLLWQLADKFNDTGVFRLNIPERTLSRIQDTCMTEPELEIIDIDPVQYSFDISQPDGIWEGPIYPEWSKQDKSSPYRVQIWVDDDFKPSAYHIASSLGTSDDAKKRGWFNYQDFRTPQDAINSAYSWHKTGEPFGSYEIIDPSEKITKGVTATRVVDAWNEEIYIVSKKGVVHDKRGPYKIQCRGGLYNTFGSPKWADMQTIPSFRRPPGMNGITFPTTNEAEFYITKYVELNQSFINFSIRIVDKEQRPIKTVFNYVRPGTETVRSAQVVKSLRDKPIKANQTIVEVSPNDLYAMVSDLRRHEQQKWAEEYAARYYGENAYRVEITTTAEYDDQNSYYDRIDEINVFDRDDQILNLDPDCVQKILEEDPSRHLEVIKNYTQYEGDDDPLHFSKEFNGDKKNYSIDQVKLSDINLNYYNVSTNNTFFEFCRDWIMDEEIDEDEDNLDASHAAGDYIIGEPSTYDPRWKHMRIFSLMDNEDE